MANADTPKYMDLMNWIKSRIIGGEYTVGTKLPSENELGRRFLISRQTVRQATSILENEGILERRRGSGTYIRSDDIGNRQRAKKASRNIGVVLTYSNDYIFPDIIKGIEEVLTKNDYAMQLAFTYNQIEKEMNILDSMMKSDLDGLIAEPAKNGIPYLNIELYRKIQYMKIPCVLLHADTNPSIGLPVVRMDDYAAGYTAADYLIKRGHTKIAGVFKADDMQGQTRYAGALSGFRKHKILSQENSVYWYTTEELKYIMGGRLDELILEHVKDATAVICYNDQMADYLFNLFSRAGKNIPNDISIISFDDLNLSAAGITSFAHPKREMGKTVGERLLKLIREPKSDVSVNFPPRLIERGSVKRLF